MIRYHRTTEEATDAILEEGFRDATASYGTRTEHTGVWLSDVPFDANEGAHGDVLLEVDLDVTESTAERYE